MEALLAENMELKEMAKKYYDQIQQLRDKSDQYEKEIETLLKFNEKLLSIIEKQLNTRNIKSSEIMSLQPISQRTELDSNIFESQFTNVITQPQNKRSAIFQSKNFEPMAGLHRQEQLSIVLSHDGQKSKIKQLDENDEQQIDELLQAYNKDFKPQNESFPRKLDEIEAHIQSQIKVFEQLKEESGRFYNKSFQKLSRMRSKYCSMEPQEELSRMIDQLESDEQTKNQLKSYLYRK